MPTMVDHGRILQEAGRDDDLLYSITGNGSEATSSTPRALPWATRCDALPRYTPENEEKKEERIGVEETKGEDETKGGRETGYEETRGGRQPGEEEETKGEKGDREGEVGEEDEEEEEEEEEEEHEEGCVPRLDQELRLDVIGTLGQDANPDDLLATVHHQASLINRLLTMVKGISKERKGLIKENRLKQRIIDVLVKRLAPLVPRPGHMPEAATARAQQAPAHDEDVRVKCRDSVARAHSLLRKIRSKRSEEQPSRYEAETKESPSRTGRAASPTPAVIAPSRNTGDGTTSPAASAAALIATKPRTTPTATSIMPATAASSAPAVVVSSSPNEDEETSPATRADVFVGVEPQTTPTEISIPPATEASSGPAVVTLSNTTEDEETSPATIAAALIDMEPRTMSTDVSITPATSTPVLPVEASSAEPVAAPAGDAVARVSRAEVPTTRGSVGGNIRPSTLNRTNVSGLPTTSSASSEGVASTARAGGRVSARSRRSTRSQPTAGASAGAASSAQPSSRTSARQRKDKTTSTASRESVCTRVTIASQMKSRNAVKTGGPRRMMF